MSTVQYLRKCSIVVANFSLGQAFASSSQQVTSADSGSTTTFAGQGEAIDFADFRVQFEVQRGDIQTPNSADVRIFNLSDQTAAKIAQQEFTRLTIQAGYGGNFGLIFNGSIKQVRRGRIDAKDTYVDITAADGDQAYNFSALSLAIAAGSKPEGDVQKFLQSMLPFGIQEGYTPPLSANGRLRGRVYYGMTRDALRDFAQAHGVLWSIQDGQLTIIPQTAYIPGAIPVISPQSGLIGVPEQTQNGIDMTVLLNPQLKIGQRVKLQSSDVNRLRYGLDKESIPNNELLSQFVKVNADGLYYVMQANHSGDTRGGNWYTHLTCLAIDATISPDGVASGKAAIFPDSPTIPRRG